MRVLFVYPECLFPSRHGSHRHACLLVEAWRRVGCDVTLASFDLQSPWPWSPQNEADMERAYGIEIEVAAETRSDLSYACAVDMQAQSSSSWDRCGPPGLVRFLEGVYRQVRPDILMINYASWGRLALSSEFDDCVRVVETHDLLSVNHKLKQRLEPFLREVPLSPSRVAGEVVEEDFFSRRPLDTAGDEDEYRMVDRFDFALTVSALEGRLYRQHASRVQVLHRPISIPVADLANTYDGPPVLAISDNPFNLQGYLYFTRKVLPLVRREAPDFDLAVAGGACAKLVAVPGARLLGFVPDLEPLYARGRFAVCPLLGGTGQQVKIVEAMAHGLPCITMRHVARTAPVVHGENGFVAGDAAEFAEYAVMLGKDKALCARMGAAARQCIRERYSQQALDSALQPILSAAAERQRRPAFRAAPKPAPRRDVVVDGAVFEHGDDDSQQTWSAILEAWSRSGFAERVVLLDRTSTAPRCKGFEHRLTAPSHQLSMEHETHLLDQICLEQSAVAFVASTSAVPVGVRSCLVLLQMLGSGLAPDQVRTWPLRQRIALICADVVLAHEAVADHLRSFGEQIEKKVRRISLPTARCGEPHRSTAHSGELLARAIEQLVGSMPTRDDRATGTALFAELAAALESVGGTGLQEVHQEALRRVAQLELETEERGRWGLSLDREIAARDLRIQELQDEVLRLGAWGRSLDREIAARDLRIQELQGEVSRLGARGWSKVRDLAARAASPALHEAPAVRARGLFRQVVRTVLTRVHGQILPREIARRGIRARVRAPSDLARAASPSGPRFAGEREAVLNGLRD